MNDRLPLFPSQFNLAFVQNRLESASRGLSFLKKKHDGIQLKLRQIVGSANEKRGQLPSVMKSAIFALVRTKFLDINLLPNTIENCLPNAEITVKVDKTNVAGLILPSFFVVVPANYNNPRLFGLGKGGKQIANVRNEFFHVTKFYVELSSLMYVEKLLKEVLRSLKTRVNAIDLILIPRYRNTISYIKDELDEINREEFFRLKMCQKKRKAKKVTDETVATESVIRFVSKIEEQKIRVNSYRRNMVSIISTNWGGGN